jgi:prepilin-type N-terminal cleavage/methylation domain-containing protein
MMTRKRAFTLMELLVVTAIIALLLAILLPSLSKARLQAKIVVVNAELSNIGLALEAYAMDNRGTYPPTRIDCNPDARQYTYALPKELVDSRYIPGDKTQSGKITYSKMEDKFNPSFAYKYIAVGERYYYDGGLANDQPLYVADGFPDTNANISTIGEKVYRKYKNQKTSPVTWILFSYGPKFDENNLAKIDEKNGFPVSENFWYSPKTHSGIITRLKLKGKLQHIGTFQKSK